MSLFESAADAQQKLGDSVITIGGVPAYIISAYEGEGSVIVLKYFTIPNSMNKIHEIRLASSAVDYLNLGDKLGYMNAELEDRREAVYFKRMPARKPIQGIARHNTTKIILQSPLSGASDGKKELSFSSLCASSCFLDMWQNKYPSLKMVGEGFIHYPGAVSFAFSKIFSVNRKKVGPFFLEYKGFDIGWSETLDCFSIDPKFKFLKETLEDRQVNFKY